MSLRCWFLETAVHRYFSRQVFLKISQYSQKNTEALEALLLQNTSGGCFWIFATANTFFQLNLVFIADSRTGFCSEFLWKQELNLKSSHWNSYVKKGVLRNFANFIGKHLCRSLFSIGLQALRLAALLKRDSDTDVFLWNLQNFKKQSIWSLQTPASETCSFTRTALLPELTLLAQINTYALVLVL